MKHAARIRIATLALGLGLPLSLAAVGNWPYPGVEASANTASDGRPLPNPGPPSVVYNGPIVNLSNGGPAPLAGPSPTSSPVPTPAPTAWAGDTYSPFGPAETPDPSHDPHERGLRLGGPRFGCSYITGGGFNQLQNTVHQSKPGTQVEPLFTQFGWQMEYRMFRNDQGMTALTEVIPLVGGLEQGLALPSLTWLFGLRNRDGWELGVGPNVGLDGVSMMLGAGCTAGYSGINIPINVAVGRGADNTTSLCFSVGSNL
jgi:hypothetical protein